MWIYCNISLLGLTESGPACKEFEQEGFEQLAKISQLRRMCGLMTGMHGTAQVTGSIELKQKFHESYRRKRNISM